MIATALDINNINDIKDINDTVRRLGHPPGDRHAMWPGGLLGRFELGRSGELRQHPGRICLGTTRRVTGAAVFSCRPTAPRSGRR